MKNLMMFAALVAAGCSATTSQQAPADTDAGVEADAPTEPESCEANAFLGCAGNLAKRCAADGVTVTQETCDSGCNAGAERCNECDPDAVTCAGGELQTCGADGLVATTESCALGCSADKSACAHVVPAYLPNVCDAPATTSLSITQPAIIDTDNAVTCTGGIAVQAGGPEVCIVHHTSISANAKITVRGSRAIAFVADDDLIGTSDIDVGANAKTSGPGGGLRVSGAAPTSGGGGGSGGKQRGGNGGGIGEFGANGGAGGTVFDQFAANSFQGGARALTIPGGSATNPRPTGGGGGGALMLVACRGILQFDGVIDAGGGGGSGGADINTTSTVTLLGGAGGGAGGYIVMQGAEVKVNGRMFANGGGGGGGCIVNGCVGRLGDDGQSPTSGGNGAAATGSAGPGGHGGFGTTPPETAPNNFSTPGGGGGSTGRIQIFTPAGVAPAINPFAEISPPLEPARSVSTR